MRKLSVLLLLFMVLMPSAALAHDSSWNPGPMKSDGASPSVTCKAVGSYQGHTRTWTYQMAGGHGDADRERAWLPSFCDYAGREDVKGWFKYQEGLDIPDDAIKISVTPVG